MDTPPKVHGRGLRIALLGIGVVLALMIGGAAVLVATFDPNSYKPQIIAAVRQATGHELTLSGPLTLKFSLQPTIEAAGVTFANPPGYSRPDMATLRRLELQLALRPLLHRQVEIVRLVLVEPDILLETAANGRANWAVTGPPAAAVAAPVSGGDGASRPLGISFHTLKIEGGRLAVRQGGTTNVLAITTVEVAANSPAAPMHVTAVAAMGAVPFTLTADTGPFDRLLDKAAGAPWPVKVAASVGGAKLGLDGALTHPGAASGLTGTLTAEVPDLAALGTLLHQTLPGLKTIALQAKLAEAEGGIALNDLRITLPQADLAGRLTIGTAPRPVVRGELAARKIDADAMLAAFATGPTAVSGGASGTPPAKPAHVIPDAPLPFDLLRAADADLRLSVGELVHGGISYRSIAAHLVLKAGKAVLDPLGFDLPGGHIAGRLTVDGAPATPTAALALQAPGLALAPLLAAYGKPGYATGTLELRADLRGAGATAHAMAATLDGTLGLAVADGKVDSKRLGGLLGDVLQKADLGQEGAMSDLHCFAARLDSKDGIGTFQTLRIESAVLTVTGEGSENLRDETINVHLRARARIAGTDVVVPVIADGRLFGPRLRADPVGTIAANVGTAAKLLGGGTGGLGGVLGALGAGAVAGGDDGGCPTALALARGQQPPPRSAAPAAPAPAPAPGTEKKPPDPGALLRQLFR